MKLLFLCKYPPIEGGVSSKVYWLARGLGERGHEVALVTNAMEVEEEYRIRLTAEDIGAYQPKNVAVYNTNPYISPKFIPYGNPYVTKLASLGSKIIDEVKPDLIYAEYFEPYCVAAQILKSFFNLPLVIRHAGSDISRLYFDAVLHHLYKIILQNASLVLTTPNLVDFLLNEGVPKNNIFSDLVYALNDKFFNPAISPIDWKDHIQNFNNEPVLLMYGKAGETKGSYDIIEALSLVRDLDFHFVYITNQSSAGHLKDFVLQNNLQNKVTFLPFVSNIQIPRFIKASHATFFLERDFHVKIHGPTVPKEVLSVGKCLVVSEEIYNKQFYKNKLENNFNIIVVDPKNQTALAETIVWLLKNPSPVKKIGDNGYSVFSETNDYEAFIESHEIAFKLALQNHA